LKKYASKGGISMGKSIFEAITDYAVNEGLNSVIRESDEYRQIQEKMDSLTNEFDALGLPKEQRLIVDRLLTSYNESGALYGKIAYECGFRDCVSLLLDIGLIKDGKAEESA